MLRRDWERRRIVVILPAISALISLSCALVIARDAIRRPRPDKLAWTIAFAIFAIAAGAEVVGSLGEWSVTLARLYYLAGAVLVVGYLALGQLYLLAGRWIARFAPGVTLLVTALAITLVWDAPIDAARLKTDGWDAIERGPGLIALAVTLNGLGTVVIVGGALYSAWRFWRLGIQRHRMIGCVLIAFGTLTVATGGTLTRFGRHEYLYIAMTMGVAIIFAGYLEARRPDAARAIAPGQEPGQQPQRKQVAEGRAALVPLPAIRANHRRSEPPADPAIAFIESTFLPLDDAALAAACRVWSVERRETDVFDRAEARRVWALRLRLSPQAQATFDALSVPAKRQLAELYHEVLAAAGGESIAGGR